MLDEPVDFIEQGGDLLDLINQDEGTGRGIPELVPEQSGLVGVPGEVFAPEEVVDRGLGPSGPEEGTFAGLAGAPEEEALSGASGEPELSGKHIL